MERKQTLALGSSLAVPCVQEVAKGPLTSIPPRYVRLDQDSPIISDNTCLPQVPVIDLQRLQLSDDHDDDNFTDSELDKLHHACKEWGFFQLINHQVSTSLVEKLKSEIQELFMVPVEEKKKYWQNHGDLEGFGNAFVVSEEQKLDWGDMFYLTTLPIHLRKPHLLPELPVSFRETLETYSNELKSLTMKILNLMAKALRMEPNDLKVLFEGGWQSMRMNYYPPCPQPELAIGLSPHSDASCLTILVQIGEVEGLQIRKEGIWVPIKPLPDAFIINVGDILEIVSNGIYRSIEHRAAVNSEKERLSIATFYGPKMDGVIGPAPSLITPETPAKFRRIGVEEYFKRRYSRKLDGKFYLDVMRIQNQDNNSST
ncbi:2-oxoglutarate (2OG) and Fe(II)-dependent oxygenase superfamily protein [Melia azedarach]|uniref:2-oxoglutarate (2OG) and Fe(II)-dependent oxygenase superfamily protein n=1 Tax=Melia azedarach TaxID=155640 RepID=A0ACC1X0M3_MELAZ|nr:2-oxoglutarate (2OG) and Fe(II)-dependent oxygenase superfamily protein [Melia azedarach]